MRCCLWAVGGAAGRNPMTMRCVPGCRGCQGGAAALGARADGSRGGMCGALGHSWSGDGRPIVALAARWACLPGRTAATTPYVVLCIRCFGRADGVADISVASLAYFARASGPTTLQCAPGSAKDQVATAWLCECPTKCASVWVCRWRRCAPSPLRVACFVSQRADVALARLLACSRAATARRARCPARLSDLALASLEQRCWRWRCCGCCWRSRAARRPRLGGCR